MVLYFPKCVLYVLYTVQCNMQERHETWDAQPRGGLEGKVESETGNPVSKLQPHFTDLSVLPYNTTFEIVGTNRGCSTLCLVYPTRGN